MVLVDSRVGSGDLLDPLSQLLNGGVKSCILNSGDAAFQGNGPEGEINVGVERKRIRDAMNSIRSGRYAADQMIKMHEEYDLCVVVVEGIYRPGEQGELEIYAGGGWRPLAYGRGVSFTYSELDKFLAILELQRNVMVRRSVSRLETAHIIANMYSLLQKDWDAHKSTEAIKTQVGSVYRRASVLRMVAAQLPGIGWGRSKKVEAKFGSIEAMVGASEKEWLEIDGIGKGTAKKVMAAIKERG